MPAARTKYPPTFRVLVAVIALLMNSLHPAGWAAAAPTDDPFAGTAVFCLASGGTAHPPGQDTPDSPLHAPDGHCHHCPLPMATALPAPRVPGAVIIDRGADDVSYPAPRSDHATDAIVGAFDARGPPA